ncbi:MAG: hypothetical protein U0521_08355 [Anaerolineae bacterium]
MGSRDPHRLRRCRHFADRGGHRYAVRAVGGAAAILVGAGLLLVVVEVSVLWGNRSADLDVHAERNACIWTASWKQRATCCKSRPRENCPRQKEAGMPAR